MTTLYPTSGFFARFGSSFAVSAGVRHLGLLVKDSQG
jgi:hypothetical protein